MSVLSRRQEEKEKRISDIKESAWKIFLRDGFDNAKIADIAKDCRLGLSTLYYYFKDKRQIVYYLMLDFKQARNTALINLIEDNTSYREFLKGYIDVHLQDIERFKFFVLADSYYNYHKQYDLNDPVLDQYDKITRKDGNYIISCLSQDCDASGEARIRVGISMILGFLRRYVLLPPKSWPKNIEETDEMFLNLHMMISLLFEDIGIDLDKVIDSPHMVI